MLNQLKEKFHSTSKRSEKIQILTVLPQVSLIQQNRILSTPNPHTGHPLLDSTVELVFQFYCDDEASRIMPGKRDCVTVREPKSK